MSYSAIGTFIVLFIGFIFLFFRVHLYSHSVQSATTDTHPAQGKEDQEREIGAAAVHRAGHSRQWGAISGEMSAQDQEPKGEVREESQA